MLVQGQVGQQAVAKGSNPTIRLSAQGDVVVSELHGRYAESSLNGSNYHASNTGAGVTLVTANALGAVPGAGSATPILALANPVNSGVNLVINRAKVLTISGTPGGGFMFGYLTSQIANYTGTFTKGVQASTLTSGGRAGVIVNAPLSGTTVTVSELRQIGGPAAIITGAGIYTVDEETAGDVIVPPGAIVGIFAQAAGTNHVVKASLSWEEVSVSLGQ
ncbi:hypothetical protein AAGS40_23290 [Paraburkholderia sp. PREW-6R]|uniref:hypothetical protein n=1 Tax=Paraburkholderia sp. PREW-6R TaxID=3141544 RepID=UPI0031F534D9